MGSFSATDEGATPARATTSPGADSVSANPAVLAGSGVADPMLGVPATPLSAWTSIPDSFADSLRTAPRRSGCPFGVSPDSVDAA